MTAAAAASQHLPGVLHSLAPALNHYGYLAVVGLVLIEDFGVPVPGETILVLAAVFAGTTGMRWTRFLVFNSIGAALWVATWTSIGYLSGSHLNAIYDAATRYSAYLAIALAALAVVVVLRRALRQRGRGLTHDRVRAPADR